jgi:hypothetical protein
MVLSSQDEVSGPGGALQVFLFPGYVHEKNLDSSYYARYICLQFGPLSYTVMTVCAGQHQILGRPASAARPEE